MRHLFVHEWFRATAERVPDRAAVDGPDGSLTFGERIADRRGSPAR
jgi:hypothetical protein